MGNAEKEENPKTINNNFKDFKFIFNPSFKLAVISLKVDLWEKRHRNGLIELEERNNLDNNLKFNKIRISSNLLYFFLLVYDYRYLNEFCPYCFKSRNENISIKDEIEIITSINFEEDYNTLRENYRNLIIDVINQSKIENEFDLAKFFCSKDKCTHFFHEKCKKENNHTICYLCKYNFNVENLIAFIPKLKIEEKDLNDEELKTKRKDFQKLEPNEKEKRLKELNKRIFNENQLYEIIYLFHSKGKKMDTYKKREMLGFEKFLIFKLRNFLMKNQSIKEELRKKYSERITLCNEFRKEVDSSFYDYIKIDLNCNFEIKKKNIKFY